MFILFARAGSRIAPRLQHALHYAAALAAIVAPDLELKNGALAVTWMSPMLMAGIGSALIFLATHHLLGTFVAGMGLFTLLRIIL